MTDTNPNTPDEAVKHLSVALIDAKPENCDWSRTGPHGDPSWDFIEAVDCYECGCLIVDGEDHADDCARYGDDYREFDSAEGPMMNYRYPLGSRDYTVENARTIGYLPLCLIETDDGEVYMALTGGGMDLSWEICEAYILLGYLPPTHFELPAMADKKLDMQTATVIAGAIRANEVQADWAQRRIERMEHLKNKLPRVF
jgi:hypothetical protein